MKRSVPHGGRYVEERAVRIRRLARMGWLTRLARRLWMSNNRLRRRTDRVEAWITAGLIVAFLVGAPLSFIAAGRWAQQGVVGTARSADVAPGRRDGAGDRAAAAPVR